MLNARSNITIIKISRNIMLNSILLRDSLFIKVIALITLIAFISTNVFQDVAWAVGTPSELTRVGADRADGPGLLKELNVQTFKLPESLGHVRDSWQSGRSPSHKATKSQVIIHIQDAHCNYAAQQKIAEIISYLNREYGIDTINLEGGAEGYNLSIFTGIENSSVRDKVANDFVKEGLLNGAEYFAVNNPGKVALWGTEDVDLYMENLASYRESLKYKEEVEKQLKILDHILNNLKRNIYSKKLMDFDSKYSAYKAGKIEFKDYITYIVGHPSLQEPRILSSYSNINLLQQSLDQEAGIDFKNANIERDKLIDRLQKTLSKNSTAELVVKTLEFRTGKISDRDFYAYMMTKAKSVKIDLDLFPEFKKYVTYISTYAAVDKIKVFEELQELEGRIEAALCENESQRELARLSKNLIILKNVFNVTLIKDDYEYYKKNRSEFDIIKFTKFIDKNAPLYGITARLDEGAERIDDHRANITKFYECSLKRDKSFLKNIRFETDNNRQTGKPANRQAILITGGFHTDNLLKLFKDKNISYISIMPNFKNGNGYECPYFKLLAGDLGGLRKRIRSAAITASISSVLSVASPQSIKLGPKVWDEQDAKAISSAVEIDVLAQGGDIKGAARIAREASKAEPVDIDIEDAARKLIATLTIPELGLVNSYFEHFLEDKLHLLEHIQPSHLEAMAKIADKLSLENKHWRQILSKAGKDFVHRQYYGKTHIKEKVVFSLKDSPQFEESILKERVIQDEVDAMLGRLHINISQERKEDLYKRILPATNLNIIKAILLFFTRWWIIAPLGSLYFPFVYMFGLQFYDQLIWNAMFIISISFGVAVHCFYNKNLIANGGAVCAFKNILIPIYKPATGVDIDFFKGYQRTLFSHEFIHLLTALGYIKMRHPIAETVLVIRRNEEIGLYRPSPQVIKYAAELIDSEVDEDSIYDKARELAAPDPGEMLKNLFSVSHWRYESPFSVLKDIITYLLDHLPTAEPSWSYLQGQIIAHYLIVKYKDDPEKQWEYVRKILKPGTEVEKVSKQAGVTGRKISRRSVVGGLIALASFVHGCNTTIHNMLPIGGGRASDTSVTGIPNLYKWYGSYADTRDGILRSAARSAYRIMFGLEEDPSYVYRRGDDIEIPIYEIKGMARPLTQNELKTIVDALNKLPIDATRAIRNITAPPKEGLFEAIFNIIGYGGWEGYAIPPGILGVVLGEKDPISGQRAIYSQSKAFTLAARENISKDEFEKQLAAYSKTASQQKTGIALDQLASMIAHEAGHLFQHYLALNNWSAYRDFNMLHHRSGGDKTAYVEGFGVNMEDIPYGTKGIFDFEDFATVFQAYSTMTKQIWSEAIKRAAKGNTILLEKVLFMSQFFIGQDEKGAYFRNLSLKRERTENNVWIELIEEGEPWRIKSQEDGVLFIGPIKFFLDESGRIKKSEYGNEIMTYDIKDMTVSGEIDVSEYQAGQDIRTGDTIKFRTLTAAPKSNVAINLLPSSETYGAQWQYLRFKGRGKFNIRVMGYEDAISTGPFSEEMLEIDTQGEWRDFDIKLKEYSQYVDLNLYTLINNGTVDITDLSLISSVECHFDEPLDARSEYLNSIREDFASAAVGVMTPAIIGGAGIGSLTENVPALSEKMSRRTFTGIGLLRKFIAGLATVFFIITLAYPSSLQASQIYMTAQVLSPGLSGWWLAAGIGLTVWAVLWLSAHGKITNSGRNTVSLPIPTEIPDISRAIKNLNAPEFKTRAAREEAAKKIHDISISQEGRLAVKDIRTALGLSRKYDGEIQKQFNIPGINIARAMSGIMNRRVFIGTAIAGAVASIFAIPYARETLSQRAAYNALVKFRNEFEKKVPPPLKDAVDIGAEHYSIEWHGARVDVISGAHTAPQATDEILKLSKDIISRPEEWMFLIEGLPDVRKEGVSTTMLETAVADKLSRDHGIAVDDIIPLPGEREVLDIVKKDLGLEEEEIVAASIFPSLIDYYSQLVKMMLAEGVRTDKEPPFRLLFDQFLRTSRVTYNMSEKEIEKLFLKTVLRLSGSTEELHKFHQMCIRVCDAKTKARNEIAAKRMEKLIRENPGKRFLAVIGANHLEAFGLSTKLFAKNRFDIEYNSIKFLVKYLMENLQVVGQSLSLKEMPLLAGETWIDRQFLEGLRANLMPQITADRAIFAETGYGQQRDFGISSNYDLEGLVSRKAHEEFHELANFSGVIKSIVRELRNNGFIVNKAKGMFKLREVVKANGGKIVYTVRGRYTELRLEKDGILVIIDERFKKDHAGRNHFAVYARNETKARHELSELRNWYLFAKAKERRAIPIGTLGTLLRRWINSGDRALRETIRRNVKYFHHKALAAEFEYVIGSAIRAQSRISNGEKESWIAPREGLKSLVKTLNGAEIEEIGLAPYFYTMSTKRLYRIVTQDGYSAIISFDVNNEVIDMIAVSPVDILHNLNDTDYSGATYHIVGNKILSDFAPALTGFIKKRMAKGIIYDHAERYRQRIFLSPVNHFVDLNTMWQWYKSSPALRNLLSRIGPQGLKHDLVNELYILSRDEWQKRNDGTPLDGFTTNTDRVLISTTPTEPFIIPMTHEFAHRAVGAIFKKLTKDRINSIRPYLSGLVNMLKQTKSYKNRTERELLEESAVRIITALADGGRKKGNAKITIYADGKAMHYEITDEVVRALNSIGITEAETLKNAVDIASGKAESDEDRDFIIESAAEEYDPEKIDALKRLSENVKAAVVRNENDQAVDAEVKKFDSFVKGFLGKRHTPADGKAFGKIAVELSAFLAEHGYHVELQQLEHERCVLLFRIVGRQSAATSKGSVDILYVKRITPADRFIQDQGEMLGWSDLGTSNVIVNRLALERQVIDITRKEIEDDNFTRFGDMDYLRDEDPRVRRVALLCKNLMKEDFRNLNDNELLEIQENNTTIHQLEHEIRRRILKEELIAGRLDGRKMMNIDLEEAEAHLFAMKETGRPFNALSDLLDLALRRKPGTLTALRMLSQREEFDDILMWAEHCLKNKAHDELISRVKEAHKESLSALSVYYDLPVVVSQYSLGGKIEEPVSEPSGPAGHPTTLGAIFLAGLVTLFYNLASATASTGSALPVISHGLSGWWLAAGIAIASALLIYSAFKIRSYMKARREMLMEEEFRDGSFARAGILIRDILTRFNLDTENLQLRDPKDYFRIANVLPSEFLRSGESEQIEFVIRGFVPQNSGLMRNISQLDWLKEILPYYISYRLSRGEKAVRIDVLGAHRGEEVASLLTALEEFCRVHFRALPSDFTFIVRGIEISADNARHGMTRLNGAVNGEDPYGIDDMGPGVWDYAQGRAIPFNLVEKINIVTDINRALLALRGNTHIQFSIIQGDAAQAEDLGDIVFCNNLAYMLNPGAQDVMRSNLAYTNSPRVIFSNDFALLDMHRLPFHFIMPELAVVKGFEQEGDRLIVDTSASQSGPVSGPVLRLPPPANPFVSFWAWIAVGIGTAFYGVAPALGDMIGSVMPGISHGLSGWWLAAGIGLAVWAASRLGAHGKHSSSRDFLPWPSSLAIFEPQPQNCLLSSEHEIDVPEQLKSVKQVIESFDHSFTLTAAELLRKNTFALNRKDAITLFMRDLGPTNTTSKGWARYDHALSRILDYVDGEGKTDDAKQFIDNLAKFLADHDALAGKAPRLQLPCRNINIKKPYLDLASGANFYYYLKGIKRNMRVILVDKSRFVTKFLKRAARNMGVKVDILNKDLLDVDSLGIRQRTLGTVRAKNVWLYADISGDWWDRISELVDQDGQIIIQNDPIGSDRRECAKNIENLYRQLVVERGWGFKFALGVNHHESLKATLDTLTFTRPRQGETISSTQKWENYITAALGSSKSAGESLATKTAPVETKKFPASIKSIISASIIIGAGCVFAGDSNFIPAISQGLSGWWLAAGIGLAILAISRLNIGGKNHDFAGVVMPSGKGPDYQNVEDIEIKELGTGESNAGVIRIINDPEDLPEKIIEEVRKTLIETHWWLLPYWRNKGLPKEQVTITIGDHTVDIFNWNEQALTEEQVSEITAVLKTFSLIADGKALKDCRYILIHDKQEMNPKSGEEMNGYGIVHDSAIKLYPRALRPIDFRIPGVSNLTGVLIHEFSHRLVEAYIQADGKKEMVVNVWTKLFGWKFLEKSRKLPGGFATPWQTDTPEQCVTDYATHDPGEDICDSMVAAIKNPAALIQKNAGKQEFLNNALLGNLSDPAKLGDIAANISRRTDNAVRLPRRDDPAVYKLIQGFKIRPVKAAPKQDAATRTTPPTTPGALIIAGFVTLFYSLASARAGEVLGEITRGTIQDSIFVLFYDLSAVMIIISSFVYLILLAGVATKGVPIKAKIKAYTYALIMVMLVIGIMILRPFVNPFQRLYIVNIAQVARINNYETTAKNRIQIQTHGANIETVFDDLKEVKDPEKYIGAYLRMLPQRHVDGIRKFIITPLNKHKELMAYNLPKGEKFDDVIRSFAGQYHGYSNAPFITIQENYLQQFWGSFYNVPIHEIGHHVYRKKLTNVERAKWSSIYAKCRKEIGVLSQYAQHNEEEGFCEMYAAYGVNSLKLIKNTNAKLAEAILFIASLFTEKNPDGISRLKIYYPTVINTEFGKSVGISRPEGIRSLDVRISRDTASIDMQYLRNKMGHLWFCMEGYADIRSMFHAIDTETVKNWLSHRVWPDGSGGYDNPRYIGMLNGVNRVFDIVSDYLEDGDQGLSGEDGDTVRIKNDFKLVVKNLKDDMRRFREDLEKLNSFNKAYPNVVLQVAPRFIDEYDVETIITDLKEVLDKSDYDRTTKILITLKYIDDPGDNLVMVGLRGIPEKLKPGTKAFRDALADAVKVESVKMTTTSKPARSVYRPYPSVFAPLTIPVFLIIAFLFNTSSASAAEIFKSALGVAAPVVAQSTWWGWAINIISNIPWWGWMIAAAPIAVYIISHHLVYGGLDRVEEGANFNIEDIRRHLKEMNPFIQEELRKRMTYVNSHNMVINAYPFICADAALVARFLLVKRFGIDPADIRIFMAKPSRESSKEKRSAEGVFFDKHVWVEFILDGAIYRLGLVDLQLSDAGENGFNGSKFVNISGVHGRAKELDAPATEYADWFMDHVEPSIEQITDETDKAYIEKLAAFFGIDHQSEIRILEVDIRDIGLDTRLRASATAKDVLAKFDKASSDIRRYCLEVKAVMDKNDLINEAVKAVKQNNPNLKPVFINGKAVIEPAERLSALYNGVADITRNAARHDFDLAVYPASGSDVLAIIPFADDIVTIDSNDIFKIDKQVWPHLVTQIGGQLQKKMQKGIHAFNRLQSLSDYTAELVLLGVDLNSLRVLRRDDLMTTVEFMYNGRKIRHTHIHYFIKKAFDGKSAEDNEFLKRFNQLIQGKKRIALLSKGGAASAYSSPTAYLRPLYEILPEGAIVVSDQEDSDARKIPINENIILDNLKRRDPDINSGLNSLQGSMPSETDIKEDRVLRYGYEADLTRVGIFVIAGARVSESHTHYEKALDLVVADSKASRKPSWVVFADMTKLYQRDKYYGRAAGDYFVESAISIARSVIEERGGVVYRLGIRSDEIAMVLPGSLSSKEVEEILNKINPKIEEEYRNIAYVEIPDTAAEEALKGKEGVKTVQKVFRLIRDDMGRTRSARVLAVICERGSIMDLNGRPELIFPPYLACAAARTPSTGYTSEKIEDALTEAEERQRIGKARGKFVTVRLRPKDVPPAVTGQAIISDRSKEAEIDSGLSAIRKLFGQDARSFEFDNDGEYAAFMRQNLYDILKYITELKKTGPKTYIIRGPPNTFYLITAAEVDGRVKWQLIEVKQEIIPSGPELEKEFINVLKKSGRDGAMREPRRFGFKAINDHERFGHAAGNQLIKLDNLHIFNAFRNLTASEGPVLNAADIVSALKAAADSINSVTSNRGFTVGFDAAVISSDDIEKAEKGGMDNAAYSIDRVEKLGEVRKKAVNSVSSTAMHRVRLFSENTDHWDDIESEMALAEAHRAERSYKDLARANAAVAGAPTPTAAPEAAPAPETRTPLPPIGGGQDIRHIAEFFNEGRIPDIDAHLRELREGQYLPFATRENFDRALAELRGGTPETTEGSADADKIIRTPSPAGYVERNGILIPKQGVIMPKGDPKSLKAMAGLRVDCETALQVLCNIRDINDVKALEEKQELREHLGNIFYADHVGIKFTESNEATLKNAMLLILSRSQDERTHKDAYRLLNKINPSFKYNPLQLEIILDSINVFKTHDDEFGKRIINMVALNLSSLSEAGYVTYLGIIKRLKRYHENGIPNIPADMTFGIEIEICLVDSENTDLTANAAATERLLHKLQDYVERTGLASRGWVIKTDMPNIEITTGPGGLPNNREGFEKFRELEGIIACAYDNSEGKYIRQGLHIHIGAQNKINPKAVQAVAFIGKAMEYYWSRLSGRNNIITFGPEALIGKDTVRKNITPFYYDDKKTFTIALNTFASADIKLLKKGTYFERFQLTIGVALAVVHNALTHPDDFNALYSGLPVYQGALYTREHSILLRRHINHLFGNNAEGIISFLQLLCDGGHLPQLPIEIIDDTDNEVKASYELIGLGELNTLHTQKGGWDDEIINKLKSRLSGKTYEELMGIVINDKDELLRHGAIILLRAADNRARGFNAVYTGTMPAPQVLDGLTSTFETIVKDESIDPGLRSQAIGGLMDSADHHYEPAKTILNNFTPAFEAIAGDENQDIGLRNQAIGVLISVYSESYKPAVNALNNLITVFNNLIRNKSLRPYLGTNSMNGLVSSAHRGYEPAVIMLESLIRDRVLDDDMMLKAIYGLIDSAYNKKESAIKALENLALTFGAMVKDSSLDYDLRTQVIEALRSNAAMHREPAVRMLEKLVRDNTLEEDLRLLAMGGLRSPAYIENNILATTALENLTKDKLLDLALRNSAIEGLKAAANKGREPAVMALENLVRDKTLEADFRDRAMKGLVLTAYDKGFKSAITALENIANNRKIEENLRRKAISALIDTGDIGHNSAIIKGYFTKLTLSAIEELMREGRIGYRVGDKLVPIEEARQAAFLNDVYELTLHGKEFEQTGTGRLVMYSKDGPISHISARDLPDGSVFWEIVGGSMPGPVEGAMPEEEAPPAQELISSAAQPDKTLEGIEEHISQLVDQVEELKKTGDARAEELVKRLNKRVRGLSHRKASMKKAVKTASIARGNETGYLAGQEALLNRVIEYLKSNNLADAINTAIGKKGKYAAYEGIEYAPVRFRAVFFIVQKLVELRAFKRAEELIENEFKTTYRRETGEERIMYEDDFYKPQAIGVLVAAMAGSSVKKSVPKRADILEKTEALAEKIPEDTLNRELRVRAFCSIAKAHIDSGEEDKGIAILDKACSIAQRSESENEKLQNMFPIAMTMARFALNNQERSNSAIIELAHRISRGDETIKEPLMGQAMPSAIMPDLFKAGSVSHPGQEVVTKAVKDLTAGRDVQNMKPEDLIVDMKKEFSALVKESKAKAPEITQNIKDAIDGLNKADQAPLQSALRAVNIGNSVGEIFKNRGMNVVLQVVPNLDQKQGADKYTRQVERRLKEEDYGIESKNIVGVEDDLEEMLRRMVNAMDTAAKPNASLALVYLPNTVSAKAAYNKAVAKLRAEGITIDENKVKVLLVDGMGQNPDVVTNFVLGVNLLEYKRDRDIGETNPRPELLSLIAAVADGKEDPKDILKKIFDDKSYIFVMKAIDWASEDAKQRAWQAVMTAL